MVSRTIGDNTPQDNQLAQAIKNYNEAKEKNEDTIRKLNSIEGRAKRRQKILNQIEQSLDRQIKHNDLNNELKTFFNMWNNIGKPLTMEIYEAQLKHLNELSNDIITQLRIVQQSIQHGWIGFYQMQTNNSYKHKSDPVCITVQPSSCNEEDYELAVDEKADASHTHEISDVTNLQVSLDEVNENISQKSQVQFTTSDGSESITEILSTFKKYIEK